jgi:hypothetical protein
MIDDSMRRAVRDRADATCEYCHLAEAVGGILPFHVEHVRARQHHGTDDFENLCWACSRCNRFKGPNLSAYDPLTDELVRLFNPRSDDWADHFCQEDARVIGRTAEGRATAELLQMNDAWRVQLRTAVHDDLDENEGH